MSILIKSNIFATLGVTLALAAVWPALVQARDVKSLEDMKAAVRENLPAFLQEPGEVVGQLLNVPLAPPLSKTFDQQKAIDAVFGGGAVVISADCRRRATAAGEADQGDCVASNGRDAGKGAYIQLNFSKNMGNGNIKFLRRSLVDDAMTPEKLPTARLSNADALNKALGFLGGAFGLPLEEIPVPPANAKDSRVRSLAVAGMDATGGAIRSSMVQKVVSLQRGFPLEKPYVNPTNGMMLTHVRGPGKAMVTVDDTGVVGAAIAGWQELRKDPRITARNAKSVNALIDEIAEDLFNNGVRQFERMNFEIQVDADWRGTYGLLVPAVQVTLATVPHDLNEDQQALLALKSTAGLIKKYSLVDQAGADTRQ
ncbi:MAG: hypothetical protein Q7J84_12740 [Sulfuricaulis sp.]|nr:hypothetical protein [Sulfuricaulis sp.]